MKIAQSMLALVAVVGFCTQAGATYLEVNPEGFLTGANNVQVGEALYNVTFMKGTCAEIFSGCDDASDFMFHDRTTAELAGSALVDQVFVDFGGYNFDTEPGRTDVCRSATSLVPVCDVWTPWVLGETPAFEETYRGVRSVNAYPDHIDGDYAMWWIAFRANEAPASTNWAVWSPVQVPEPATFALFGLGLAGVFIARRRNAIVR